MNKLNFICFSINNWEKRKARKQQFMAHLSERNDVANVLYVEPPMNVWRLFFYLKAELSDQDNRHRWKRALTADFTPITSKLKLYTPLFFIPFSSRLQLLHNVNLRISTFILKARLSGWDFRSAVIWIYHPFDYLLLKLFPERAHAVFDWAEEWSLYFIEFSGARREQIRLLENKIIKAVDTVFVCSERMNMMAKPLNPRCYHIFDGTIYEQFQIKPESLPPDIRDIARPTAGYLGTISRRMDLDLISRLAETYPEVSFVFIGNVHREYLDITRLKAFSNIHFLNGKDYSELGGYASCIDIWLLPYNPDMVSQSPTKIFDYLATGKPIVSTNLTEVRCFKEYMYIADDSESFISLTETALKESLEDLREKRRQFACENSWTHRAAEIFEYISNTYNDHRT